MSGYRGERVLRWLNKAFREGGESETVSVQDLDEEAFEVSTALGIQGVFQGDVVFLQVHVLHGLQVDLWVNDMTPLSTRQTPFIASVCLLKWTVVN